MKSNKRPSDSVPKPYAITLEDIEQKEKIMGINEEELVRNKRLQDMENDAFEEEKNQWEVNSERILEEIKVCKEALVILNSEGVKNYVLGTS